MLKFLLLLSLNLLLVWCNDLKGFDDNTVFTLEWPGRPTLKDLDPENEKLNRSDSDEDLEFIHVTSHAQEKYKCSIPKLTGKELDKDPQYVGPTPLDLIQPLFTTDVCSYRIESYWTYELCHGNYIKQFHEERDGKTTRIQEYFLGQWNSKLTESLKQKSSEIKREKLKYKKIEGLQLPYLEVEMVNGTNCDLNNEPRSTKVLYVCFKHGKNEIYSFKETSTCNYEIVVLTPTLCTHPLFQIQETTENLINCVPDQEKTPVKPKSLLAMEVESMKMRYQKLMDVNKSLKDAIAIFKVDTKDGKLTMELVDDLSNPNIEYLLGDKQGAGEDAVKEYSSKVSLAKKDTTPVEEFLAGKFCLTGGTGWWTYDFCYGRYVREYHIDKNGEISINLGIFKEDVHKNFMLKHPEKRPKPVGSRKQITHFYSHGSICDRTGLPRTTEVVLKCLENAPSPDAVSLYLLEPKTCSYIFGVESPLICDILDKADEDGIINMEKTTPVEKAASSFILDDVEIRFQND